MFCKIFSWASLGTGWHYNKLRNFPVLISVAVKYKLTQHLKNMYKSVQKLAKKKIYISFSNFFFPYRKERGLKMNKSSNFTSQWHFYWTLITICYMKSACNQAKSRKFENSMIINDDCMHQSWTKSLPF